MPSTIPLNPVTVTIPTQRGYDAVVDLGLDSTGKQDCAATLKAWMNQHTYPVELHFPPGHYYFASTVETNQGGLRFIGDGALSNIASGAVVFFTDQPLPAILWFNCTQAASNLDGPWIENIQFQDSSPTHDTVTSAIRITNTANAELKVGFLNMVPRRYTTGTVVVATGSNIVTGSGTQWTADMAPGWIVIAGYPYEIVTATTSNLILSVAYQGPNLTGASYAVNYHGIGVWLEPGLGFTQYGKDWSLNGRIGCALFASSGTGSTGTSRIKVRSGYLNGQAIPDSIACYLGPFSDTFLFDVMMNAYAFGVVIANGHQHDIQHADYENAGTPPPVTGKPAGYNSCHGMLVMSDNSSNTWGNRIGGYFRQVGTAIELYGQPGKAPNYTVIGVCTFRSNLADVVLGNATNTQGFMYP